MGKYSQYGVILDAGSSGTRIYIYKWKHPIAASRSASIVELRKLPKLKLLRSRKIHPGITTFVDDVASVGRDHLQALIDTALAEVPADKIEDTPIFLMATAGVRFLPKFQQTLLLEGICTYLRATTKFNLPSCNDRVHVISGETEGLYGWISINYLLESLDRPEQHSHGKGHHTYGFLDMGGASAQIAFAPNKTEALRHENDLTLIRLRHLDGSSSEFKIFSATWLGFGANKARSRYVQTLVESHGDSGGEIPDPCIPKGLRLTNGAKPSPDNDADVEYILIGTGAFGECLRKTYPLLGKEKPCEEQPCLLNGKHAPAIDFEVNRFIGVSEYWHGTHGVFGEEDKAYDLATFQNQVIDFCSRDWNAIQREITKRKKSHVQKIQDVQEACFKASWLINILHEGIGIPRVGLGSSMLPNLTTTNSLDQETAKQDFLDPFKAVDTVRGVEVSWTLGKMVLYASGQILPSNPSLPVGFGSNVASGISPDFEHAGSVPLSAEPYRESLSSDSLGLWTLFNILGLVAVIILLAYAFRKSDRRHRLSSFLTHWRRQYCRKSKKKWKFLRRLFDRDSVNYERVLEEGDTASYDLETASNDPNCSDITEALRGNKHSETTTLKMNSELFDQVHPSSVMDRAGLVIRTESRDRLSTNVQMLKAGKRSRAGSPIRLKSPFKAPLQEFDR